MTAHNKNNFDTDTEIKLWRPQRQPKLKNQNQKIRRSRNQKITSRNPKSKNRRGPKTQKKGSKTRQAANHGEKTHENTHKKHATEHQKTHTRKSPYFEAGRLRRTVHISASNLMKVRRQNMSKKNFAASRRNNFLGPPRVG